jgi:hypothetical protein
MRSQRASEAQAASRQSLGEQSGCNRDAIMIELMSNRWHSASDAFVAGGRRAWRASEALTASRQPPRRAIMT